MEALGLILLVALLFIYTPAILDHIFCYILENRYNKLCEKRKKKTKNK